MRDHATAGPHPRSAERSGSGDDGTRTGRFRRAEEIQTLLRRAGVGPRRRLICYDSAGIGACKLAFALTLIGYDDIGVYDAGWAEVGRPTRPPAER